MYREAYSQYRISKTTISNYWIRTPATYPYLEALRKLPLTPLMYSQHSKLLKRALPSFFEVVHFQDHNQTTSKRISIYYTLSRIQSRFGPSSPIQAQVPSPKSGKEWQGMVNGQLAPLCLYLSAPLGLSNLSGNLTTNWITLLCKLRSEQIT